MEYKRKGDKLIVTQSHLSEYLDKKLQEISNLMSNIITALIIVSLMVVILSFKASDLYLYALILLPLIARGFIYSRIEAHLHKSFAELLNL